MKISLNGNFVFSPNLGDEFGVLDGDNIGGRVGGRVGEPPPAARQPPILGGKNPSGNLTQGGLFESWFFLTTKGAVERSPLLDPLLGRLAPMSFALDPAPLSANFSSADAIVAATGVSAAAAARIVAARGD
jgi:hypothetical protein